MLHTPNQTDPGMPGCWFGGEPTLPPEIPWPIYTHVYQPRPGVEVPMSFLAQINLEHLPEVLGLPPLPSRGTLFIFYDASLAPMAFGVKGDEPSPVMTGDAVKVIYVAEDVAELPPRTMPPMPDLFWHDLSNSAPADGMYRRWPFDFVVTESWPAGGVQLSRKCNRRLKELRAQRNRLLNLRYPIEKLEWRPENYRGLHTIFGASQASSPPTKEVLLRRRYPKFPPITSDHMVLFRFESDARIGHSYINSAPIAFWITRQDLEVRNFDRVVIWKDTE